MKIGHFFCLISSIVVHSELFALDGKVVMMKGDVTWINSPTGEKKLSQGETVTAGAKIKTGEKSFAKIVLTDQTNLTIGPNGQIDINTQLDPDKSLVNLVAGKLRASTPPGEKEGSPKLIIKTQKVSMGVRGTDLRADFNPVNNMSTLMTFTGAVEMGKLPDNPNADGTEVFLGSAVTVMVGAGQMSAEGPSMPDIMQPVLLNPAQMESIKGNETFDDTGTGEDSQKKFGSALPPGVDAGAFAADKKALGETLGVSMNQTAPLAAAITADGVMQGGFFSEKAGYIPPPADSRIDENTGLPIPPSSTGGLDASGDYVPPEGLKLMDNGQFVLATDAPSDIKVDDIPIAMGAPPTTELVTEAAFTQAVNEGKVNADGSINDGPPPPPTEGGDGAGGPPAPSAGMEAVKGPTAALPEGDFAAPIDDLATDLANEIAQDVIQDTIDEINDSTNTSTSTSGRSNVTITIDPIN